MGRFIWWASALVAVATLAAAACDGSDSTPPADAGPDADAGATYPIRYVVVLVKENHTFDNLFGAYPGVDGASSAKLSDGGTRPLAPTPPGPLADNPTHDHPAAVTAYDHGAMDGFDLVTQPVDPLVPFEQYTKTTVPSYYAYADQYVLCDAFFSTTLGGSFPAYLALVSAQSPAYENPGPGVDWSCADTDHALVPVYDPSTCAKNGAKQPCFSIPSIVDHLPDGVTWRTYTDRYVQTGPLTSPFDAIQSVHAAGTGATTRLNSSLIGDLKAGDMANITYVWGGNHSEHPPEDICLGENDTVAIANAIMQGPHWNESLLVVTYDDWGGFYDHVAPTVDPCQGDAGPFTAGFRVPTLLISPWTAKGGVYHTPTEQASIPRLIEDLFGLPRMSSESLTARDGAAGDLLGAFDFQQTPAPGLILQPRTCP
jgi:phospholipase C